MELFEMVMTGIAVLAGGGAWFWYAKKKGKSTVGALKDAAKMVNKNTD